jgi:hypothetical protein
MRFLINDPILIFQNGHEISARFLEQDGFMIAVNLEIGKVFLDNRTCRIELDYQEKLISYLTQHKKDNLYFEDLYFNIVPAGFKG